jgi:hypothetical protein
VGRDYKLALVIGPAATVAVIWLMFVADVRMRGVAETPGPWLLAVVPALAWWAWFVRRHPSLVVAASLIVGMAAIGFALFAVTLFVYWWSIDANL